MEREVLASTRYVRQLRKLPKQDIQRIIKEVEKLKDFPDVVNVKALKARKDYRLRIGRYRVIFEIREHTVYVTQVTDRKNAY